MKPQIQITKLLHHMRPLARNKTAMFLLLSVSLTTPQITAASGVCAVAKELGNSLAIDWIADEGETVTSATEKTNDLLRKRGFTKRKLLDLHVQASTSLPHGHMVIIKSTYTTIIGKIRNSYGCGFSRRSSADAEQIAIKNLRSYSWGWKPEFGYELHTRHSF